MICFLGWCFFLLFSASSGKLLVMLKRNIDWVGIAKEYRLGHLSIIRIAQGYGCDESTIRYRAKKHGWVRNIHDKVSSRIRHSLAADDVVAEKRAATLTKRRCSGNTKRSPFNPEITDEEAVLTSVDLSSAYIQLQKYIMRSLRDNEKKVLALLRSDIKEERESSFWRGPNESILTAYTKIHKSVLNRLQAERELYSLDRMGWEEGRAEATLSEVLGLVRKRMVKGRLAKPPEISENEIN